MKKWLLLAFSLISFSAFSQVSLAYYPWESVLSVSTNPNRVLWLDARFQTNALLGQLNTTIAPLFNVKRTETYQIYVGPGFQLSPISAAIDNDDLLQNVSLHIGTRVAPLAAIPNLRVALEVAPTIRTDFESGVLRSRLGVVYVFRKRAKKEPDSGSN